MRNKYFQLVTELFIEKTLAYLVNALILGHIPCFDECWGVDNRLDVAPLENMEEDHSFLFLKKNLMKIFLKKNLKNLNISKELKILIFFFWKIKKSWSFEGIWKFLLKICSLEIFPLEYGFVDFSFEKWRIFLLKIEKF